MKGRFDLHPDVRNEWAKNIHDRRERFFPRQRDFADALGIGQATVCRWETGTQIPTDAEKVKIAQALHTEVRTLFPLTRGTGVEVAA